MRLWRAHGGDQHGPNVETVTMPLHKFFGFVRAAIAAALNGERSGQQ